MEWVKPNGRRNEALDCAVYAYAAAIWVGIERWTEVQWAKIEEKIAPAVRDLFAAAPPVADGPQPTAPPVKPTPATARPNRRPIQPIRSW
jgi:phage terminase large subunit GpA-like protein